MSLRNGFFTVVFFIGFLSSASAAGIKVYVAEGSEAGISIDKELTAISKYLKRTRFKSFKYIGSSGKNQFPVKFSQKFKNGLEVTCDGPAHRLKVIITHNGKEISNKVLKIEKTFLIGIPINGKNYLVVLHI